MKRALLWLRRDFRIEDQAALSAATRECDEVVPVFVVDPAILDQFGRGEKPLRAFFSALQALRGELQKKGKDVLVVEGDPVEVIPALCAKAGAGALYYNKDYEPASIDRDERVSRACGKAKVDVHAFKDHVLFEESEILNKSGEPYRVFTPFKRACFAKLKLRPLEPHPAPRLEALVDLSTLSSLAPRCGYVDNLRGAKPAKRRLKVFVEQNLASYETLRNLPATEGTAMISSDLRSGSLSPRQVWNAVIEAKDASKQVKELFLSELLWRDFFILVGFHFPKVFEESFNSRFELIRWRNDEEQFKAWCEGRTGYPIVDAGMRQLAETGFMHNRVRMITAMFLVKDLLVDWKWGERFFQEHLIDGDLAVNNGNWQWCASTGSDAQPYFRIFNPTEQGKRYDSEGEYVRRWVPELRELPKRYIHEPLKWREFESLGYPRPIVDHSSARMRCLLAYKTARK